MAFRIEWTEPALDDFEDITRYVSRISAESARRLGESILTHCAILANFPRIGPVFRPSRRQQVYEILCGVYRIFYRVIDEQERVEILAIWHGSRHDPRPAELLPGID
jgi:plasmid stabilization system protein ParE